MIIKKNNKDDKTKNKQTVKKVGEGICLLEYIS